MIEHLPLAFLSMPGTGEWMVILLIGLMIFGRKLPEVARNLGKSVNEFKKGLRDFQDSADEVIRDVNQVKADVVSQAKDAAGLNDYHALNPAETTTPTDMQASADGTQSVSEPNQSDPPTVPPS
jgi:sec-independent protein translocase protein TatA